MPDDNHPTPHHHPSWVGNEDYTGAVATPPTQQLVPSSTTSAATAAITSAQLHTNIPPSSNSQAKNTNSHANNPPSAAVPRDNHVSIDMDPINSIPPPTWPRSSESSSSHDNHNAPVSGATTLHAVPTSSATTPSCTTPIISGEETSLPPPWRNNGDFPDAPVRSPSAAAGTPVPESSLRPQPSTHSFRISEAESRHSEPVHVTHMIDPVIEAGPNGRGPAIEIDVQEQQMDNEQRVTQWLIDSDHSSSHHEEEEVEMNVDDIRIQEEKDVESTTL